MIVFISSDPRPLRHMLTMDDNIWQALHLRIPLIIRIFLNMKNSDYV